MGHAASFAKCVRSNSESRLLSRSIAGYASRSRSHLCNSAASPPVLIAAVLTSAVLIPAEVNVQKGVPPMPKNSSTLHAFEILESNDGQPLPPVIALVGDDRFLKQQVREHFEGDNANHSFERASATAEWADVKDVLSTQSLFSTGPQQVYLADADDFVSRYRTQLEDYVTKPHPTAVLAFDVRSLPSNTKLRKKVAQVGWVVECKLPQTQQGQSKQTDVKRVKSWICSWAKQRYGIELSKDAVETLIELVALNFGRLDQELAKLALFVSENEPVTAQLVQDVVGGWQAKTNWEMLDDAAEGKLGSALEQLDRLLQSGEAPQALFGSTAWSLRRFADAARIYELRQREGLRPSLSQVLVEAGFRKWPPDQLKKSEAQLKQIGRARCGQLYSRLLETDLKLKGSHSTPNRARLAIELLLLSLAPPPSGVRSR